MHKMVSAGAPGGTDPDAASNRTRTVPERRSPAAPSPSLAPSDDASRIAIEEWFLRRGMPSVARSSSGPRRLLPRAAPALVVYAGLFLTATLSDAALREIDREVYDTFWESNTVTPEWYLIAFGAGAALALLSGILIGRVVRRRTTDDMTAGGSASAPRRSCSCCRFSISRLG